MNKPAISPDFTLDDIRALRDYNSMRHLEMTTEDIKIDIGKSAGDAETIIENIRKNKAAAEKLRA